MEVKDYLYIFAILVTLLLGISNIAYNLHRTKITTFINCVTAERVKWIANLRENIATFCGLTHHFVWSPLDQKEKNDILNKVDRLRILIPLQLNPDEEPSKKITELLNKIPDLTDTTGQVTPIGEKAPIDKAIDDLVQTTQMLLKQEWNRVKEEAYKGKLTKS